MTVYSSVRELTIRDLHSQVILCFGVLFFLVKHTVDRYNLVYWYDKYPTSGGRLAATANHLVVLSVCFFMVGMVGFLAVKKTFGPSSFVLVCWITLLVLWSMITICRPKNHGGASRNSLPPTLRHVLDQTAGGELYSVFRAKCA